MAVEANSLFAGSVAYLSCNINIKGRRDPSPSRSPRWTGGAGGGGVGEWAEPAARVAVEDRCKQEVARCLKERYRVAGTGGSIRERQQLIINFVS